MSMFGEVIAEASYETVPLASSEAAMALLTRVKEGDAPLSLMYETEGLLPNLALTSLSGAYDHKVYVWDKALLDDPDVVGLFCDESVKKLSQTLKNCINSCRERASACKALSETQL